MTKRLGIGVVLLLAIATLLSSPHSAQAANPSSETGAFARIDVGARALGMGGAGTAFERSAWATSWNPANLYHVRGNELAIDTVDLFGLDIARHTEIAYAWRTEPKRNVMRDGRLVEEPRAEDQVGIGFSLGVTTVDLDPESYSEYTPAFSLAGKPWGNIALGGTLRLMAASSDLENTSAFGFGLDLGLTVDPSSSWVASLAIKNLLSNIGWSDKTSDTLPISLTGAAAYRGLRHVTLAVEATSAADTPLQDVRFGGEWRGGRGLIALRGGAIVHQDRNDDDLELTFGAGTGAAGIHLDYAFVGHSDTLGDTHRMSLALRF